MAVPPPPSLASIVWGGEAPPSPSGWRAFLTDDGAEGWLLVQAEHALTDGAGSSTARDIAAGSRMTSLDDVVRRAIATYDFAELLLLVVELKLPGASTREARRLITLGRYLLELDLEDLERSARAFPELTDRIRAVSLPPGAAAEHRGLLATLVPTMELLLEVINVQWERRDVASLLATVHLMAEYLALGAWEPDLGHAADPRLLLPLVTSEGSRWGRADCPASSAQRSACRSLRRAVEQSEAWEPYLESDHAYVAEVLARCATCTVGCSVSDAVPRADRPALRARVALAGDVAHGRLMRVRHASPVGHSFSLPDPEDLRKIWDRDWRDLVSRHRSIVSGRDGSGSCLPGLDVAVSAACGVQVRPGTLLHDVMARLSRTMLAHLDEPSTG